jgi:ABC-type multidrug transport system fused ATPase/permease subunit
VAKEERKRLTKAQFKRSTRIFKYVLPYRGKFTLGLLFLLFSSLTFMTFPALIGRLVGGDGVKNSPIDRIFNLDNIDQVAILLVLAFMLQAVFSFMRIYLFADVTERAMAQLRQDTYSHLIELPMSFFAKNRVGELNSRISNDISQLQETFMTTLAELVRQIITILFGAALLLFFSVELALVMLLSVPTVMLAAYFFGMFIRKLSKQSQEKLAAAHVIVDETLQGIQNVKAYSNEFFERARYNRATEDVRLLAMKGAKWRGAFASFVILGLFGAIVLVIWYGVRLKNAGEIGLDVLMSFVLYSVFVGGSFAGVANVFGKVQKAIGATESLFDLMEEEQETYLKDDNPKTVTLDGNIEFKEVSFAYESRSDRTVIKNLSFRVRSGQTVALVGASGSGKSTIASLILQFYKPNEGMLLFDGLPAMEYSLKELRSNMALVPQEVLLFGGSIRENIAYGKPSATEKEILSAAEKANALEFIRNFPEGLDTIVGERGIQLSGGQRQRIAIARAILKNPKILILDEATSSLDSESERTVQQALDRLMQGRTSIVIAHRLSTIKGADNILVIDHGALREQGNHESLMEIPNGVYRNLTDLQILA